MHAPLVVSLSDSPRHRPVHATATERSEDRKLTTDAKARPVSTTSAAQWACPDTCPFMASGCYAESGPMAFTTRRLNAAGENTPVAIALVEAAAIRRLSGRHPLRLHLVGDCKTDEAARIVSDAAAEHTAKNGQPAWTYTHAWRDVDRESWQSVSVLASCETEADVAAAVARGYATAMVVENFDEAPATVDGTRVVPCLQQTGARPDCASCLVCSRDGKLRGKVTIAFAAHGHVRKIKTALERRGA
jgi:hypothetical protein